MGKGGGCVPSKKKHQTITSTAADADGDGPAAPIPIETPTQETDTIPDAAALRETSVPQQLATKLRIFVVFYSMYGHVEKLAKRMKKGIDGVDGVQGVLYRVAETLPDELLEQMKAPPKDAEIPVISAVELAEADGVLFGFPTRYGCMAAQMKAFFDSTGQLWKEQKLAGKPAGFFVSTGTQGGGQETTA